MTVLQRQERLRQDIRPGALQDLIQQSRSERVHRNTGISRKQLGKLRRMISELNDDQLGVLEGMVQSDEMS